MHVLREMLMWELLVETRRRKKKEEEEEEEGVCECMEETLE